MPGVWRGYRNNKRSLEHGCNEIGIIAYTSLLRYIPEKYLTILEILYQIIEIFLALSETLLKVVRFMSKCNVKRSRS